MQQLDKFSRYLEIARVYNDVQSYPTIGDVAAELNLSSSTISTMIGIIRREHETDIPLISRAKAKSDGETPMSERPELFMAHWTKGDCIQLLQRMAYENPDRVISRNDFRVDSGISESTWNRYFGTFEEFKRQAGIKLARGARAIELNIARHASRDSVEPFNEEKRSFAGRYKRDHPKRDKIVLVGSDFHDISCDLMTRRVFIDTAKRIQPECIFLNGDMLDLPEFGRYSVDPRTWDVVGRIKWMHSFLADLREASPESHIVYLEGNHEFRILRHLAEATPALKTVLADLHGFTVSSLLGLDQFEIEYVGKADLRAWTDRDAKKELHKNNYFLWDMLLGDHFPTGIKQGVPGWNGHHHQLVVTPTYSRIYGSSQWVQLPSGHVANAEYCEGEKWSNGFLIVHADTVAKKSIFEPITVRDKTVVGGEYYLRREDEVWHKDQEFFV